MDKIAKTLLNINAVTLRVDPPYTWTSGIKSPIYTDNRLLMSYPKERVEIVDGFLFLIKENGIKCDGIAATATAGIPWGSWLAERLNLPLVYVRSSSKGHGKENKVEGKVEQGKAYLIVEDLISTGKSSVNSAKAIRESGGIVEDVVAIFSYELPWSEKSYKEAKVCSHALTNISTLLEVALKEKHIKEDEKNTILKWKEDPEQWAN